MFFPVHHHLIELQNYKKTDTMEENREVFELIFISMFRDFSQGKRIKILA